jgi:hypothetical protein
MSAIQPGQPRSTQHNRRDAGARNHQHRARAERRPLAPRQMRDSAGLLIARQPSGFNNSVGGGTAGAVVNAVWHATGIRVRKFPITLDRLIERH